MSDITDFSHAPIVPTARVGVGRGWKRKRMPDVCITTRLARAQGIKVPTLDAFIARARREGWWVEPKGEGE